jgi:hypothetical protein
MAVGVMVLGAMLLKNCFAQDRPLGDVARETRAQTAEAPKPAKVLSNEETDGRAITASDDPVDVLAKAKAAVLRDTSHSCREVVSGTFAGTPVVKLTEIAGPDRVHVTVEQSSPQRTLGNLIVIGNDAYGKVGDGPWQKASPADSVRIRASIELAALIPGELANGYNPQNLKLVGPTVIQGSATLQYQSSFHGPDANRTINIWVGAGDYLPRRTQVLMHALNTTTQQVTTTDCTYGTKITIEPPL